MGAVGQTVIYPLTSTCAVRGSTVTLPCTFTPLKSFNDGQREVPLKIVRVRWCKNHEVCQGGTPFVYDSNSTNSDPRYQYLGDMKTNCTLQIRDVQQGDNATFRFRMRADHPEGHFTNRTGVTVRVDVCTFHQLEVTWLKDDHALSDTGPSLHLHSLTAEDSGNYTCALKTNMKTLSEPYSLQVEAGAGGNLPPIPGVVFVVLLVVIALVLFIIERRLRAAEDQRAAEALYSLLAPLTAAEPQQKLRMAVWDKNLLWSFMFLLAVTISENGEFYFDSLAAAALHPNPV
ncbi:hypothetical protein ACER0C_016196 [Sarotherodon galilaeus]